MNSGRSDVARYHAVLIGCDSYPVGRQLAGCVNDIDAIERLLLDSPGIGIPADQIHVSRLAAPLPGAVVGSRFANETELPSRDNIVRVLRDMATPRVAADDRVLIYYSGHGSETAFPGATGWHEALVPVDLLPIYDVELSGLIHAIAERTADLTLVLDCCHSAGIPRDALEPDEPGADRFMPLDEPGRNPVPDATLLALAASTRGDSPTVNGMLRSVSPAYMGVVACQGAERASEGRLPGQRPMGVFTHSLVRLVQEVREADQRAELRWSDLWPQLLVRVQDRAAELRRGRQHPGVIGRLERRVFGGAWEAGDLGYPVTARPDGRCSIGAGYVLGVTEGALLAIYGPRPARFPVLGTPEDLASRRGQVRVLEADRMTASAQAVDAVYDVQPGDRARLIKTGRAERLRVMVEPADDATASAIAESGLLEPASAAAPDPDVRVTPLENGGWTISNDVEAKIATVPACAQAALRAGLESYHAHYATTIRLASNSTDQQLASYLSVRLLDYNDAAPVALSQAPIFERPEAPRNEKGVYTLPPKFHFCIEVGSTYAEPLHVAALNCGAAGQVEFLGDTTVRRGDSQVVWFRAEVGSAFVARPDFAHTATDRLVIVAATTLPPTQLAALEGPAIQGVVDEVLAGDTRSMIEPAPPDAAPAELWGAVIVPVRMVPA